MSQWPVVRLGDITEVIAGQSPEGKHYNADGEGLPFYQGKKDFGARSIDPPRVWTREVTKVAEAGDILMSVRAPVGPVNFAVERCCIGRGLAAIRPGTAVLGDFLFHYLESIQSKMKGSEGAVFSSINKSQISAIEVLLPPLAEQKRIVAKLDEVSLLSDRLELNSSSRLANSKELRTRLLAEVFSEPAPWVPLGELVEVLDSRRVPITKKDRVSGDVPYYGATGVQDFVADFLFDEDLVLLGEDGAKWSAGDRSAFLISGKTWVNNHAHVLRPDRSKVLDEWLAEWLCVADLVPYTSGATVQKLNQARMKEILVPVPPVDRQRDLTTRIARIHADTQMLDANATAMLAEIALLRKAALSSLLSGAS